MKDLLVDFIKQTKNFSIVQLTSKSFVIVYNLTVEKDFKICKAIRKISFLKNRILLVKQITLKLLLK